MTLLSACGGKEAMSVFFGSRMKLFALEIPVLA